MAQQNDDYLYHYTTVDAFLGMVEKQEIWASNIFYLNDTAEFHLAVTLARELLRAEMNRSDVDGERSLEKVYNLLDEVRPGTITKPVFVCSFSKNNGDDLNQWRAYCPNGGVAVGFRWNELYNLTQQQEGIGSAPQLVECIYEEDKQRQLIRSWVDRALTVVPQGSIGKKMSPQEVDEYRVEFLKEILADKPIKHKAFAHEQEWRLVVSLEPGWEGNDEVGYRSRNGFVIPYWRFNLDPGKNKSIWRNIRVVVGPSPHPHEMRAAIESLLKRCCWGNVAPFIGEVKNSIVPYRYW